MLTMKRKWVFIFAALFAFYVGVCAADDETAVTDQEAVGQAEAGVEDSTAGDSYRRHRVKKLDEVFSETPGKYERYKSNEEWRHKEDDHAESGYYESEESINRRKYNAEKSRDEWLLKDDEYEDSGYYNSEDAINARKYDKNKKRKDWKHPSSLTERDLPYGQEP